MDQALQVGMLAFLAGAMMAVGGAIASIERIRPEWLEDEFRHTVIAFGGGALFSAVALVLVPEGAEALSPLTVAMLFGAGGVAFMLMDMTLAALKSPAAQLAAMLSDFFPESLAMGAAFATGDPTAPLLALLIGIQNLPEGFNAYRELIGSGKFTSRRVLAAFAAMSLVGPAAALAGLWVLASQPNVVAGIMLFAAGGIMYLTFQDIAPQAKLQNRWAPPLGAVVGFLLGLIGKMLVGD